MLISWFLKKSTKHSTKLSQQSLYQKRNKYDKNNSKAIFCLLEPLGLPCHVHTLITQWTIYRFPFFAHFVENLCKHAASMLFDEIDIFSGKMSLKLPRKIDRIS